MSIEYKVTANNWSYLSEKLERSILDNPFFEKQNNISGNSWFEFRAKENIYEMPDIGILIKPDHLYISRYDLKDTWFMLENIHAVFEESGDYEVEEL